MTPDERTIIRVLAREIGGYHCATDCDDDCEALCHEGHQVVWKRDHDYRQCATQVALLKLSAALDEANAEIVRLKVEKEDAWDEGEAAGLDYNFGDDWPLTGRNPYRTGAS